MGHTMLVNGWLAFKTTSLKKVSVSRGEENTLLEEPWVTRSRAGYIKPFLTPASWSCFWTSSKAWRCFCTSAGLSGRNESLCYCSIEETALCNIFSLICKCRIRAIMTRDRVPSSGSCLPRRCARSSSSGLEKLPAPMFCSYSQVLFHSNFGRW